MVGKCGGLPLAVVVLGGLLFTKLPHEWQRVRDHIGRQLMKDQQHQLSEILTLSYNDLPYQLKSCFLYIGIFPEDSEIDIKRLIRLWIAEGFIPWNEERMEDIAEDYLNELIDRSMIQVADKNWINRISKCRIHDLLRDLFISKAEKENFFDVYPGNKNSPPSAKSRRYVAHSGITGYFSLDHSNSHLRSLLLFNPDNEFFQPYYWKSIYQGFKLLRVLDLNNISLSPFPDEIGNLIHLRYLGIVDHTQSHRLPTSIGNLVRLQYLDLRLSTSSRLPDVIWKMKHLRYLRAEICEPLRIDTLEELQTLRRMDADIWIRSCSVNLKSLRKLKIRSITRSHGEEICHSIAKNNSGLQSLTLVTKHPEDPFPTLTPLGHCYNLSKLKLLGMVENLPERNHEFPPKLTTLILIRSKLKQDPMVILSKLPNLTHLSLGERSYEGREMVCPTEGFLQLQYLKLERLFELEEWKVERGAIPRLKCLFIVWCGKFIMAPEGLRFVTTLKELDIRNMPEAFKRRTVIGGEDWHKVEHIPSVTLN